MAENFADDPYLKILRSLLEEGVRKGDRTKTGMREIFGTPQMVFDLNSGKFPLLTTKKMFTRGIIVELLWFLRGDTNIKFLHEHNVHIWDEWADEDGNLGPVYGKQWRKWEHTHAAQSEMTDAWSVHRTRVDQIVDLLEEIRTKPDSRRMMVSAWNPPDVPRMALPPCHCMFQSNVQPLSYERRLSWAVQGTGWSPPSAIYENIESEREHRTKLMDERGTPTSELHLKLYQRSADWFLGVPFNIASYALLTKMIAKVSGLAPGRFIHTFGSAHLYENHVGQAMAQLEREPFAPPTMTLHAPARQGEGPMNIDGFGFDDFELKGYERHPTIKAPIAV